MKKISDLLTGPSKWCKGWLAIDEAGAPVLPYDLRAVSWCLLGAIDKCTDGNWTSHRRMSAKLVSAIGKLYPQYDGIVPFNNDRATTFAKVKRVLKLAHL